MYGIIYLENNHCFFPFNNFFNLVLYKVLELVIMMNRIYQLALRRIFLSVCFCVCGMCLKPSCVVLTSHVLRTLYPCSPHHPVPCHDVVSCNDDDRTKNGNA